MEDVPPDIEIPEQLPPFPPVLRWVKKFERACIEITNLLDRSARKHALENFERKWAAKERESAAVGLAIRVLVNEFGPDRTIQIAALRRLPDDMESRALIYQQHDRYEKLVESYRARLNVLPSGKLDTPSP